jgi:acyl dehydratase
MSVPGLEHLPGTKLPEGSFTITAEEDEQLAETLGSRRPGDGIAHPSWAYMATQRGIGISVAGLCELADFDVNDGPMLGSVEMEYHQPLRVGVPYKVTGEILGIERKRGRKTGVFDILRYREELVDPDGRTVAASTNTFILRRKEA